MTDDNERRKDQHIDAILNRDVSAHHVTTGFEALRFEHCALPELDLDQVSIETEFLGYKLAAPLLVSSMTGGVRLAGTINHALAEAAQDARIAFAVGSQRVAIEGGSSAGFSALRDHAPDVPILANFGAAQLNAGFDGDDARRALDMIGADALIIHLNPLQEAVQAEGDRNWSGLLDKIGALALSIEVPLIVKEVGFGISGSLASRLVDAGVAMIDVAGAGGTSWAAVEAQRAKDPVQRAIAEAFRDWGIPTARALADVRRACPTTYVIASGGIRDGLDAAKAIRLGADLCGLAAPFLEPATRDTAAVRSAVECLTRQLQIVCFATGSANLAALRRAPLL